MLIFSPFSPPSPFSPSSPSSPLSYHSFLFYLYSWRSKRWKGASWKIRKHIRISSCGYCWRFSRGTATAKLAGWLLLIKLSWFPVYDSANSIIMTMQSALSWWCCLPVLWFILLFAFVAMDLTFTTCSIIAFQLKPPLPLLFLITCLLCFISSYLHLINLNLLLFLCQVVAVSGIRHLGAIKAGLRRASPIAQVQQLTKLCVCVCAPVCLPICT